MKTIKHYVNWFNELNRDEKETLKVGVIAVLFVLCMIFLIWLQSTNSYPVLDAKTTDTQTYKKKTYELKPSFDKYVNHVYNDKFK
jgi:flagellar biosynthesis/type III secretory pathway M-ring protein FliF/YscJ